MNDQFQKKDEWNFVDPLDEDIDQQLHVDQKSAHGTWFNVLKMKVARIFSGREKFDKILSAQWIKYYDGLYQEKSPSLAVFSQLLDVYGMKHIPNPYREGNESFYRLCPDGVTLADVDFVLGYWQRKNLHDAYPRSSSFDECSVEDMSNQHLVRVIEASWPKLYQHRPQSMPSLSVSVSQQLNEANWDREQHLLFLNACACLSVLFLSPSKNWTWMFSILHRDNIGLLCKVVYDNAPSQSRENLVSCWLKNGWVVEKNLQWFKNK